MSTPTVLSPLGPLATGGQAAVSTLSTGDHVYAFFDGSERARIFDNSVALPTATVAPYQVKDPQGTADGPWILELTYAAGSLDAGSPAYFVLDQQANVIKSSTATGNTTAA